jgi:hypothetical protein
MGCNPGDQLAPIASICPDAPQRGPAHARYGLICGYDFKALWSAKQGNNTPGSVNEYAPKMMKTPLL